MRKIKVMYKEQLFRKKNVSQRKCEWDNEQQQTERDFKIRDSQEMCILMLRKAAYYKTNIGKDKKEGRKDTKLSSLTSSLSKDHKMCLKALNYTTY